MSGGTIRSIPEEQMLLTDRTRNGTSILAANNGKFDGEKRAFLPEPVRLTPAWEETNLPNDELNFKGMTMEQARLETHPPTDKYNIVYLIMFLHGMGTLLPWNMFINAKSYFVDYKLSYNYTQIDYAETAYAANFLPYLGIAAQGPNILFNWLNVFIRIKGKLSTRIVWSIVLEMLVFVATTGLAMIDSADWPGIFFGLTMTLVVLLNMANGIYQNTIFGLAAKLPPKYTGALIIGSNMSGTFSSLISIASLIVAPNARTAAIYYFITALFVLSLCFDTYFALPLNRFYKYNELMHQKEIQQKQKENTFRPNKLPHCEVLKKCWVQLFNIFFIFFITLSLFPSLQSDIKKSDENFIISDKFYLDIMCFLSFNLSAMIGSSLGAIFQWPNPKHLWIAVVLRGLIFVPLYVFCNYQPLGSTRELQVLIANDWAYLAIGLSMGLTSGYFSSLAMQYNPACVEGEHAHLAGMYGAAVLVTGICCGLAMSMVFPYIVSHRLPF